MPSNQNKRLFWVFALSSSAYFIQGIEALPFQGLLYYLKETLGYSPEKIMFLTSVLPLAWILKPPIGYIVDNFLSKKSWIFLALALSVISVLFLGLLSLPVVLIVAAMMINSANTAFRDVSVDGIMCVEGKQYAATGRIQSVQWIAFSLAGLITGLAGGYIAFRWDYRFAFLCLIPFYFLAGLTAYFYKDDADQGLPVKQRHFFREMKLLFSDKNLMLLCLFLFLYRYSPSFGTPLFFIQRDVFKWGKVWIGALATISTLFEIAGALFYFKFCRRINIKRWLFFSVFLGTATTLSYLYYTPYSAIVYNILYSLVGMFIFIMALDFMARNTLKGLEATSFALLTSVSNIALISSNLSGAFLLPVIGLKWLIAISALSSLLCLPLINKIRY